MKSQLHPSRVCLKGPVERGTVVAGACVTMLFASAMLGGCYEHVTQAGFTSTEVREKYEPNVEEEGPSWLNEFMWGDPPKGEDAVKYYRRKNTLGIQQ